VHNLNISIRILEYIKKIKKKMGLACSYLNKKWVQIIISFLVDRQTHYSTVGYLFESSNF